MLKISVISPDRILFEGEAESIELPGSKAPFTVLKDHAPLVSHLDPGIVTIAKVDGSQRFVIEGGFAEVRNNKITALVEGASLPEEIQVEVETKMLNDALAEVTSDDYTAYLKELKIKNHRVRLAAVSR